MPKVRLNISTDKDLVDFIKLFAQENRTTVADIFTQYILAIKRTIEGENLHEVLSNPAFHKALVEAQAKLQDGSAKWHSYDEVFGE